MSVIALITFAAAVLRQWQRNYRERRALALLPARERHELSFVGDVEAEIAKPFWRN